MAQVANINRGLFQKGVGPSAAAATTGEEGGSAEGWTSLTEGVTWSTEVIVFPAPRDTHARASSQ